MGGAVRWPSKAAAGSPTAQPNQGLVQWYRIVALLLLHVMKIIF